MIFPWMFDEVHALKHLKEAAHLLAAKEDWPPLYDVATLNNNQVYYLQYQSDHRTLLFPFLCIIFFFFLGGHAFRFVSLMLLSLHQAYHKLEFITFESLNCPHYSIQSFLFLVQSGKMTLLY